MLIGVAIVAFVVLVSLAGLIDAFVPGRGPARAPDDLGRPLDPVPGGDRGDRRPGHVSRAATDARRAGVPRSIPAIVVGIVIVVLSQVFVALVPRLVGVAALAGSLASAFVALAWLSFTFQALLYGAAWVRVRDEAADRAGSDGLGSPAAPAEPGGGRE